MSFIVTGLTELQKRYAATARAMKSAEARAVRRVGTSIATAQSRGIAAVENLRISTIKDAIKTVKQPTPDQPRVVFEVRGKGIPLGDFIGSRVTSKGLSVQPLKGGPRTILKAGFAPRKYGGAFFGRAGTSGTGYGSPHVGRTPIVKLYGPNVLSQYIKAEIQKLGADTWNTRLPIELERESNFALKQAGLI
jgi:hypothetical protein